MSEVVNGIVDTLHMYFERFDDGTYRVGCDEYDDGYGMDLLDAIQHFVEMNEDTWNSFQRLIEEQLDVHGGG